MNDENERLTSESEELAPPKVVMVPLVLEQPTESHPRGSSVRVAFTPVEGSDFCLA